MNPVVQNHKFDTVTDKISWLNHRVKEIDCIFFWYSKTCVKCLLKIDKIKVLMTNGSLMKEKQQSAIILTCIKR